MGDQNFMGGLLGGMAQGMQKQQELTLKKEYQKSLMDINKFHGKLFEAQAKAAELKTQGLPQSIIDAMNATEQGAGTAAQMANAPPPQAQAPAPQAAAQPQGPMWGPGSLPKQMAAGVHPVAATNLAQMQAEFGEPIKVTDSYRTTAQQADLYARKPNLAAPPGRSNHEKGLAFDIDPGQANRLAQAGLLDKYGFQRPMLGQGASGKNEPWHIELAQAGGQTQPQPMQPPGGQQLITPNFPKPTGISKMKLGERLALDVYFKQIYDLDTKFRETKGKFKGHGNPYDGFNITNEDTGQTVYFPPTMQKYGRLPIQTPTGAEYNTYAPNQINVPIGQTPGTVAGPGGAIQTKPDEFVFKPVESPTGERHQVAVPKPQPGASYQDQPSGAKISDAGRFNMIMQADNRIKEVNELVMPNGKINRSILFKASVPMGGIGEGSQLYSKMYQVVDSALRLETGAQANESEIKIKMGEYWPMWKDTDATIRQKMKDLNEYANGAVELSDPTGEIRKMRQPAKLTTENPRNMKVPPKLGKAADPLGLR